MEVHRGFVFEGFERRFLQTNMLVPWEAHQVLLLGVLWHSRIVAQNSWYNCLCVLSPLCSGDH